MSPRLSRFVLTAHVTFSVGWLGSVVVFLVLAIAGITSNDPQVVRAMYLAMDLSAWCVIVPASIASLTTGIAQGLFTKWGLFKHYWVVVKLLLTTVATALLLLHMQPISFMADLVADHPLTADEFYSLRVRLIADAAVALFVLLLVTGFSIYKPWGRTPYGVRKKLTQHQPSYNMKKPISWGRIAVIGIICLFIVFIVMHIMGGGLGHH